MTGQKTMNEHDDSRWFYGFLVAALLIVVFYWPSDSTIEKMTEPKRPVFVEVPYTLEDGTPCTIIRGGTFSGMVGVTCNYRTK